MVIAFTHPTNLIGAFSQPINILMVLYTNYPSKHMPYSDFTTITKAEEAFGLTTVEGRRFIPDIELIKPSQQLVDYLEEVLPIAIATGSEKVRSELIISPILIEVWKILEKQIAIFSGKMLFFA
jgi:hypothetical protein